MDFLDFQKQMIDDYGYSEMDLGFLNRIAVVRFEADDSGIVSGYCRYGRVRRHDDYPSQMNAGDVWVCELIPIGTSRSTSFNAKPIQKLDAQFLYDLTKDQRDAICSVIWEDNKDTILEMMDEKYHDIMDKRIEERVNDAAEQKDSEILLLKQQLATANHLLSDKDMENERLRTRISVYLMNSAYSGTNKHGIIRTEPEAIHSDLLEDGTYSVRFTTDRSRLFIRQDENGHVSCTDGTMRLRGLDNIIGFMGTEELRYDKSTDGGLCVYLA